MNQLRGRIAAALGDEVVPVEEEKAVVGSSLMTPASGIAVAATVAVVALLGLGQLTAPVDEGLQDAVAIDQPSIYTEPSAADVIQNVPSARELDLLRRHNDGDILYRMATFEVSEDLQEIEPDGQLAGSEESESAPEESLETAPAANE